MEFNADLMQGFVRRTKILDQENRATQAAMKHAVEQWRKDDMEQKESLRQNVRDQVRKLQAPLGKEIQKLPEAAQTARQEEETLRFGQIQELILCRERLAQLRTAEQGIFHGKALEGKQSSAGGAITIEKVLRCEPDFIKLAVKVNELYRSGNMAKARQSYADFQAQVRAARTLLEQRCENILRECASRVASVQEKLTAAQDPLGDHLTDLQDQTDSGIRQQRVEWANAVLEQANRSRFSRMELDMKLADRNARVRGSFQTDYPPMEMEEACNKIRSAMPAQKGYVLPEQMPELAYLGNMEISLTGLKLDQTTISFLNRDYPFLTQGNNLVMPYGMPFGKAMNTCFSYTEKERFVAVREAKNLVLRLYRMHRPGDLRTTFVDPVALGESFAIFGKLVENRDEDNLIGGQIWASPADINRQLQNLVAHIADVNQRCLQGQYASLGEYNREALFSEPYRVLMLMDYPAGMTKQSLELLERIVRLGPKCGVFTMVMRSKEQYQKAPEENRKLVDQLDQEFRKMTINSDLEVVFDGTKLPGQRISWSSDTGLKDEDINRMLRELRSSYGFV